MVIQIELYYIEVLMKMASSIKGAAGSVETSATVHPNICAVNDVFLTADLIWIQDQTPLCSPGPYAGWRLPFVIVAVPTLLLALLMLLTAEEPPRGVTEAALQVRRSGC